MPAALATDTAVDRSKQAYEKVDALLQALVTDPYRRTELAFAIVTYGTAKAWDAIDRMGQWPTDIAAREAEIVGAVLTDTDILGARR